MVPYNFFTDLYSHLLALQIKTNIPEINDFVAQCKTFMHQSSNIQTARFEWVDGVLIKALEEGKWLVLDNANLCSSAVLDRLNSLLEPNGFLSINEHCGPDGEPKIVKPHPDFRLFMTMDPRFGELSRAMRNRAVEIYIDVNTNQTITKILAEIEYYDSDAFLQRYRRVVSVLQAPYLFDQIDLLAGVALDNLSIDDAGFLGRFTEAARNGLVGTINPEVSQVFHRYTRIMGSGEYGILRDAIQHEL